MNLGGLNWIDLILLFLVIASLAVGFAQGLLRQVIGLAALYVATILATQYYTTLGDFIRAIIFQPTSRFLNAISFFIIVVVVWMIISWLAFDAYSTTKIRLLPLVDQLGGSILSLVTLVATLSLVLPIITFAVGESWPGNEVTRASIEQGIQTARLVPVFEAIKPLFLSAILPWLPHGLPSIFNL
ncbi:MAG: CvpA family protein [Chloroflexi bacterium]|nr:CvpA family protein [Chloroflexota bacterium]